MTRSCGDCYGLPAALRSEAGHLTRDGLVPHSATVHLIDVGSHPAKPARELAVGDVLVYNYGSTATVVSVADNLARGGGTVYVDVVTGTDGLGARYSSSFRADRLVAVRP